MNYFTPESGGSFRGCCAFCNQFGFQFRFLLGDHVLDFFKSLSLGLIAEQE